MAESSVEIEIKLPMPDAAFARNLLERHGFGVSKSRVFESNTVYDWPGGLLRGERKLLRIRQVGATFTLTFKGPPYSGRHKTREELEAVTEQGGPLAAILSRLGLRPTLRYEKFRTEFARRGEYGIATLDETPIGCYVELEGPADWIDRAAADLGFDHRHYVNDSYASLYVAWCRSEGRDPSTELRRTLHGQELVWCVIEGQRTQGK
jgi:adenylate cyclase class 2